MPDDVGQQGWVAVAHVDDLPDEGPLALTLQGRPIALYRIQDGIVAISDVCTHAYALLSDGFYEDGQIECPLHQACFDVRTGKALTEPAEKDLATFEVRIADSVIMLKADGEQ